jgi:hypothetical protein
MSVSIARRGAHAKEDAPVQIVAPFGRALKWAMTGICTETAIAIPHRKNVAFDNGKDPDSGEFPGGPSAYPIRPQIESDSECSRQIAFSNARETYGTEKFVGTGRFLSCVSRIRCLKYQTKTIRAIRIAIPTITPIRFANLNNQRIVRTKTKRRGRMHA